MMFNISLFDQSLDDNEIVKKKKNVVNFLRKIYVKIY